MLLPRLDQLPVAIDDVDDVIPARVTGGILLRHVVARRVATRDEAVGRAARVLDLRQASAAEDEHAVRRLRPDAAGRSDDVAGAAVVLRPAGDDIVRTGLVSAALLGWHLSDRGHRQQHRQPGNHCDEFLRHIPLHLLLAQLLDEHRGLFGFRRAGVSGDDLVEQLQRLLDVALARVHLGEAEHRRGRAWTRRQRLLEQPRGLVGVALGEVHRPERHRGFPGARILQIRLTCQTGLECRHGLVQLLHVHVGAAQLKLHARVGVPARRHLLELRDRLRGLVQTQVGERQVDPRLRLVRRLREHLLEQFGRAGEVTGVVGRGRLGELPGTGGRGLGQLEFESALAGGGQPDLVVDRLIAFLLDGHLIIDRPQPAAVELPGLVALERGISSTLQITEANGDAVERRSRFVGDRALEDRQLHLGQGDRRPGEEDGRHQPCAPQGARHHPLTSHQNLRRRPNCIWRGNCAAVGTMNTPDVRVPVGAT